MKKLILIVAFVVLWTFVASSCNRNNAIDGNTENIAENEKDSNDGQTIDKNNIRFNTVINGSAEEISIFQIKKENEKFSKSIYTDDSVDKTISIDVFSTEYDLNYVESAILPISDMKVNTYKFGEDGFKILINAHTGEIVECIGLPYEYDVSTQQQYYMDLIKALVPEKYALESYECEIYTHYYELGSDYMRSREIEGFKICGENEELVSYRFSFSKKIGNVNTGNHISVEFSNGKLYVELYDFGYDEEFIKSYINDFISVEAHFNDHISSKVKSEYNVVNIENKSYTFFMKDNIPYIMVTSEVRYSENDDPDITFTELLTTVNRFEIIEK